MSVAVTIPLLNLNISCLEIFLYISGNDLVISSLCCSCGEEEGGGGGWDEEGILPVFVRLAHPVC